MAGRQWQSSTHDGGKAERRSEKEVSDSPSSVRVIIGQLKWLRGRGESGPVFSRKGLSLSRIPPSLVRLQDSTLDMAFTSALGRWTCQAPVLSQL